MEDENKISEQYKKAFNHGYMIREQLPHVLEGMKVPENEPSVYTRGFTDGVKEYEKEHGLDLEQKRDKLREQMQQSQAKERDQSQSR